MGRLRVLFVSVLVLALTMGACARSLDTEARVLRLEAGSITERDLRTEFRAIGRRDPRGIEMLCDRIWLEQIEDLDLIETLAEMGLTLDSAPGVAANPAALTRAVEIVEEECLRWANI